MSVFSHGVAGINAQPVRIASRLTDALASPVIPPIRCSRSCAADPEHRCGLSDFDGVSRKGSRRVRARRPARLWPYPRRLWKQTCRSPGVQSMSDQSRPYRTAAVIPAAGRGVRLGPGAPRRSARWVARPCSSTRYGPWRRPVPSPWSWSSRRRTAPTRSRTCSTSTPCPSAPTTSSCPAATPARSRCGSASTRCPRTSPSSSSTTRRARWCPSTRWTR